MASGSFVLALFAILVNLAFGSPVSNTDNGACWHAAVQFVHCDVAGYQSYCLCKQIHTFNLQQWDKICTYLDEPLGTTSPKVLCSFLGFPDDDSTPVLDKDAIVRADGPVITAGVVERDTNPVALTTVDGTVYNPLRTTNFCGLPGMFCNKDSVADPTGPTQVEAPAITQRAPEPVAAPLTTFDGSVYNPLHSVGFCGLPGMFCAEDSVAQVDDPVEVDAPMITTIAGRAPQPLPLTTVDGSVYNPLHSVGFAVFQACFADSKTAMMSRRDHALRTSAKSTQVQPRATPSLESPRPNPPGPIPYIPFPTMGIEKRDQEGEAPLPLRNTKTLVQDNMAPKAGAESTFKVGWQLVLGVGVGMVGTLALW